MANIRVQVLTERKYRPAVTIGFRDALTILRGINNTPNKGTAKTSYYNSFYLVAGKTVVYNVKNFPQKISLHVGVGYSDFENSRYQHLHGLFAGTEYQFHERVPIKLLVDYDTQEFRFGISAFYKTYAHITVSTLKFEDFAVVITGCFNLHGLLKK